ncbi:MAG: hypothetical protein KF894_08965 [Labilithrix sp.]|nr:hypothetical protein [Labilithrix sp.]
MAPTDEETPVAPRRSKTDHATEHQLAVEQTRQRWREALAYRGLLNRWTPNERDAVSAQIRGSLPDDVWTARELERVVSECRRTLEDDFVAGGYDVSVDPGRDASAALALVLELWKLVERRGPTHISTRWSITDPDVESDEVGYARLYPADQRRWRVAFMRYLNLCDELGYSDYTEVPDDLELRDPESYTDGDPDRSLAYAVNELPFSLVYLDRYDLPGVFAAWRETRAGAKRSGSGTIGKWKALAALLKQAWGAKVTPRALEAEWDRYGKGPRRPQRRQKKR